MRSVLNSMVVRHRARQVSINDGVWFFRFEVTAWKIWRYSILGSIRGLKQRYQNKQKCSYICYNYVQCADMILMYMIYASFKLLV